MIHETEEQRGGDDRDEPTVPRATELNYTTDDEDWSLSSPVLCTGGTCSCPRVVAATGPQPAATHVKYTYI